MCRLFGFRSIIKSQVHNSLVSADNALISQSERNPDGWGVAYYQAGAPHVIKSVKSAFDDHIFPRISGVVTSETVLAHVRKATNGNHTIINTHPFQFGHWVFVHNGNIQDFKRVRSQLLDQIPPVLRRFIFGDTDSEVLFYLLLSKMAKRQELDRPGYSLQSLADAVNETIDLICTIAGDLCEDDSAPPTSNFLTFVITNGRTMLAHQGGKLIYVSTHKKQCSESRECPHYKSECERELPSGFVSHLIVSSEPLQGENVWQAMQPRQMVGVDWRMKLQRFMV